MRILRLLGFRSKFIRDIRAKIKIRESANLSITQLGIFRFVTLITSTLIIISSTLILAYTPLSPNFSSDGFNSFIEVFKFPLWLLASYIPIVGLIGVHHRSIQTIKQIEVAQSQNNFSNYYKHLEEFDKYCCDNKLITDKTTIRAMHKRMFPEAKIGDYSSTVTLIGIEKWHEATKLMEELVEKYEFYENTQPDKNTELHKELRDLTDSIVSILRAFDEICVRQNSPSYSDFYKRIEVCVDPYKFVYTIIKSFLIESDRAFTISEFELDLMNEDILRLCHLITKTFTLNALDDIAVRQLFKSEILELHFLSR